MFRWLGWCFYWISRFYAWAAQKCGYVPPAQEPAAPAAPVQVQVQVNVWQMMAEARMGVRLMTEQALQEALANRPRNGRDQAVDNPILAPLSDLINRAIQQGDYRLAAEVFRENYAHVLAYEKLDPPCEVHKGALAFDVARGYLRGWDFFAAMHYFELAQHETIETTKDEGFSIYDFKLFEANFWDSIQQNTAKYPIDIYQEFWGVPYNKQAALDDYADIDKEAKLAYIIATVQRVRLQHIADHSGWTGSKALRLGYWSLASDIARFLEIEAKRGFKTASGAGPQDTLLACLEQGYHKTNIGDISKEVATEIPKTFPRKEPAGGRTPSQLYEANFDPIMKYLREPKNPRLAKIYLALYLLGFTRNQVAHKIDSQSKLFQQLDDAKFLVDLFLALCRTRQWRSI
jgi:hypothetical protein